MNATAMGRSAGLLLLAPGCCPFTEYSSEEHDWNTGWRKAVAEVLDERDQERRRRVSSECSAEGDFAMHKTPDWR